MGVDHCRLLALSQTSRDVRLESAKRSKADIDQAALASIAILWVHALGAQSRRSGAAASSHCGAFAKRAYVRFSAALPL
jgi:hypothetical protein